MESNNNTHLEKTDKCKIGYVSEVKSNAWLNEISIKNISGGDPFDLRPLYNTNRTMTATCCLWLLANTLPKFTVEKSMNKRIVIFPFNGNFEVSDKFEEEMYQKLDSDI